MTHYFNTQKLTECEFSIFYFSAIVRANPLIYFLLKSYKASDLSYDALFLNFYPAGVGGFPKL